jgi:hypothetical protein
MRLNWTFVYVIFVLLGLVTINDIGFAQDQVRIRLETTDTMGNPITEVALGEDFLLKTYVQDLRETSPLDTFGVFSAYMDVTYPAPLVSLTGPITFVAPYGAGETGDTSIAGLLDEVGSVDGISPLGKDEFLMFTVSFVAVQVGEALFVSDPADDLLFSLVTVFGRNDAVPPDLVEYGITTLSIVPEPRGAIIGMIGTVMLLGCRRLCA